MEKTGRKVPEVGAISLQENHSQKAVSEERETGILVFPHPC